jgi:transposase
MRVRAVEALRRGLSVTEVAKAYLIDRTTLFRWHTRHGQQGNDGLLRRPGSGRPRLLDDVDCDTWRRLVLRPATDYGYETGLWTVRRLQSVIREELHVSVSRDTVWRRLRDAGLTYQKPERAYFELDEATRQEWARAEIPRIRRMVRKHRAILYFQDESNVSLTAFLGKTWAPCGQTPRLQVTGKRGGVAAMSAISRIGHLVFRLYEKRIASNEVIDFLGQMLAHIRVVTWSSLWIRPRRTYRGRRRTTSTSSAACMSSTCPSTRQIGIRTRKYGTT